MGTDGGHKEMNFNSKMSAKPVLIVRLYPFSRKRAGFAGTVPCAARMSVHVEPSSEYSSTWPS